MKKKLLGIFVCTLMIAASATLIGTTVADWDPGDGHKMHFPQLPDPDGWDVYATAGLSQYPDIVLADDWRCSETGNVKDIHFWGSWKGDIIGDIEYFVIAIHSDIPANPPNVPYSRPGTTLWEIEVYDWVERGPYTGDQGWFWPDGDYIPSDHDKYFQYNIFLDEEDWFPQENGRIYWLAISAVVDEVFGAVQPFWGWKSSENHWNDDACWSYWGHLNWQEMYEPGGGVEPITNEFWAQVNPNGYLEEGGGTDAYGDRWYYYENTGWWNVWFYDHPFDPNRYKEITIEFDFNPEPTGGGWATIALNWATPYWEPGGPPPIPPLTPGEEQEYVARYVLLGEVVQAGHYAFDYTISDYNPEWVSVDIMGMNFDITGIITHECLPSGSQQSLDLAFVITGGEEPEEPSIEVEKLVSADGGATWSDEVDVELGDTVRFKIKVHNDGDVDLNNIQVIDTLPGCLEYADNADPIEPTISGNKLSWTFSSLKPCNTIEIEFDAKAIEDGVNENEVSVIAITPTGAGVSDSDTATVNVGEKPVPKIDCRGGPLSWTRVPPGSTQTGTILVGNIGDPGSQLKWKVCSYPSWGTWSSSPSSGTGLTPAMGDWVITVTVVAPTQQNQQNSGQITLCNEEDASDTCTIQVSLATPKNKPYINTPFLRFLENLLEQHPLLLPMLRCLLGL